MDIETLEHALHMWPPWQKTIDEARASLGYDPAISEEQKVQWSKRLGWQSYDQVKRLAGFALQLLDLPESFERYWVACFYSDYLRPEGGIDYEQIRQGGARVRPPNPIRLRLTPATGGRWKSFRLDGSLRLVTKADIDEWRRTILALAQRDPHPLTELMRSARAPSSPRKKDAQRRLLERTATFEDILREEYWAEEVDGELRPLLGLIGINRTVAERTHRKTTYDRVRLWCEEIGTATLKPTSGWWRRRPGR